MAHRSQQGSTGGQAARRINQMRPRVIEPRQSNGVPPEREAERVDSVAIESSDTSGVPIVIRFGADAIQLGRSWRRGARSDEDLKRMVSKKLERALPAPRLGVSPEQTRHEWGRRNSIVVVGNASGFFDGLSAARQVQSR